MQSYRSDFPIYTNYPDMIYLDSASSTHKPQYVIDRVNDYITHDYANVGRGYYDLAIRSDDLYHQTRQTTARYIQTKPHNIIYTYSTTYAYNIIAQSCIYSSLLSAGDEVLLYIGEHHADIVVWQMLSERYGIIIKRFGMTESGDIDLLDLQNKYTDKTKILGLSLISNVLGINYTHQIADIRQIVGLDTMLILDASQAIGHISIDISSLNADIMIWGGHKMMGYTGIGVIYMSDHILNRLKSPISGGSSIQDVSESGYIAKSGYEGWEPGTPNIIGAISMMGAIEYIQNIGGIQAISDYDAYIYRYMLYRLIDFADKYPVFATHNNLSIFQNSHKIGLHSIYCPANPVKVSEHFAKYNICVRTGGHCAYPLHKYMGYDHGSIRISTYIYNDLIDIDRFVEVLEYIYKDIG